MGVKRNVELLLTIPVEFTNVEVQKGEYANFLYFTLRAENLSGCQRQPILDNKIEAAAIQLASEISGLMKDNFYLEKWVSQDQLTIGTKKDISVSSIKRNFKSLERRS